MVIRNMTPGQDYNDFSFSSRFAFVPESECHMRKWAKGPGGSIALRTHAKCQEQPWVIEASQNDMYIFLKVNGKVLRKGKEGQFLMPKDQDQGHHKGCETRNRILVYSGDELTVICPGGSRTVEVFSQGWFQASRRHAKNGPRSHSQSIQNAPSSIVLKYIGIDDTAGYLIQWLELSPTPEPNALSLFDKEDDSSFSCSHTCPELSGCIRAELWCDGTAHCPSGFDETEENCAHVFVPILYMYAAAALTFVFFVFIVIIIVQRLRSSSNIPLTHTPSMTLPINQNNGPPNGLVFGHQEESITNLTKVQHTPSNSNGAIVVVASSSSTMDLLEDEGVS